MSIYKVNKVCKQCGSSYLVRRQRDAESKFCSKSCMTSYYQIYSRDDLPLQLEDKLLCNRCKCYKSIDEFYNRNDFGFTIVRKGHSACCKICQNQKNKKIVDRYRESIIGTLRENLKRAKNSCKKRKLDYDIDINYISDLYNRQEGKCALTGKTLSSYKYYNPYTVSIDRIDSSKGYIKENIHLVCWAVNQMKNDYTIKELLEWCNFIVDYNKKKS